jgi:hypothetical protein
MLFHAIIFINIGVTLMEKSVSKYIYDKWISFNRWLVRNGWTGSGYFEVGSYGSDIPVGTSAPLSSPSNPSNPSNPANPAHPSNVR